MKKKNTFVIGDVHGHLNRLEALLMQEELINADGLRTSKEIEIVQLGDLGHFGSETKEEDLRTWSEAPAWLDVILWGNHDRATIDRGHAFSGYSAPLPPVIHQIQLARSEGKLKLAHHAHGYLLTHAGLNPRWYADEGDFHLPKMNAESFANWLNQEDEAVHEFSRKMSGQIAELPDDRTCRRFIEIRDIISYARGGWSPSGGILWRDAHEDLYEEGFPQVFGHSVQQIARKMGKQSYCVDVGTQYNGTLSGVYLPEGRVATIKLDESGQESRK